MHAKFLLSLRPFFLLFFSYNEVSITATIFNQEFSSLLLLLLLSPISRLLLLLLLCLRRRVRRRGGRLRDPRTVGAVRRRRRRLGRASDRVGARQPAFAALHRASGSRINGSR